MLELFSSLALVAGAAALVIVATKKLGSRIASLALLGLVACVLATFAQVAITEGFYGGGDMSMYLREADTLARYARVTGHVEDLVVIMFGGDPRMPFPVQGIGMSTGSIAGFAGLLFHIFGGAWAVCFAFSMFSFSGKLFTFLALRPHVNPAHHSRVLIACLLVPSLVFWTSVVLKESVVVAGIGWLLLGLERLRTRRLYGLCLVLVGATAVSLSKAYMLFPLSAGVSLGIFWHRGLKRDGEGFSVRPSRAVGGLGLAVLLMIGLGELFPRFALDTLGESAAHLQHVGSVVRGGSTYSIGNSESRTLLGQLAYAPLAIVTSLFRPFPFEVRNALMLVNAAEALVFVVLAWMTVRQHGLTGLWRIIRVSPFLIFCLAVTLLTALGVGLTTTNLGTLSRYRVPMFPFYVSLLLILSARPSLVTSRFPKLVEVKTE